MPAHSPVMRLVRFMTHLNIGAMLGMAAWLIWSSWQVSTGQVPLHRVDLPVLTEPEPMRLVPVKAATRFEGHCLPAAAETRRALDDQVSGADL
jgi:hypothetical protein